MMKLKNFFGKKQKCVDIKVALKVKLYVEKERRDSYESRREVKKLEVKGEKDAA